MTVTDSDLDRIERMFGYKLVDDWATEIYKWSSKDIWYNFEK